MEANEAVDWWIVVRHHVEHSAERCCDVVGALNFPNCVMVNRSIFLSSFLQHAPSTYLGTKLGRYLNRKQQEVPVGSGFS